MARKVKYIGRPTYGLTTKDLKVLKKNGNWKIYKDVAFDDEINVDDSDDKEDKYFKKWKNKTFVDVD